MAPQPLRDPGQFVGIGTLERDAWSDLIAHADRAALAAAELSLIDIDGASVLRCPSGGPLTNRAYGAPATTASLRAIRRYFDAAHVPLYFVELADDERDRGAAAAFDAGLVRYRRRMIHLVRATGRVTALSTSLDIGLATREEMGRVGEIFCAGFDAGASFARVLASIYESPRWRFVVARHEGEPVATGVLYASDGAGYLMGAATLPRFRSLGAQGALIAARLVLAHDLGCRIVASRTGEPIVGDPQHSQRNMVRNGFHPIGTVESYAPPGIVWPHGRPTAAAT